MLDGLIDFYMLDLKKIAGRKDRIVETFYVSIRRFTHLLFCLPNLAKVFSTFLHFQHSLATPLNLINVEIGEAEI